ncbi:NADPH-dependent 7-cyano-7-deazaguanine reductase QueF [Alteromonas sp. ASW11-130]|uniref:NADPH-dependent 7-cyano-7-deazaguanine reductase QueF n=1 Tax=Alteromonas sp. ASW11-130 TaxID=3015775 RepID=UPI0022422A2E|nr:NADPH-dependent 7-cyano-7-deazaguanine reductase QueF [Alteromonas sp. ASW11-130]MCW8091683.1 NADPH-dependent 7-cyano-7-deazaguanine reductase QueF [Alteromonas sp. ASW11-130]
MTSKQPAPFELPTHLTLGKAVGYETTYNPSLLQSVPRALNRDSLSISNDNLPFHGDDIWTGYELSWLLPSGKPQVAIFNCYVPVTSPNIIESKSFKLYLNSFNQSKFNSVEEVSAILCEDLSTCAGTQVKVDVFTPSEFSALKFALWEGTVIDDIDIEVNTYQPDSTLLQVSKENATETLISHLLKSNCLITQQPDWASILIRYSGSKIQHDSLLAYLISFRQHNEFHEQCVERIYCDLMEFCKPKHLTVFARYTRRGGLDINPFRSNFENTYNNHRLARQ